MQKDDVIYRAEAIDILDAYQVMVENGEENPYAWARLRMSELPSAQPDFDITVKINKAYDDGYEAGYLQGRHDWGDLDE